MKTLAQDTIIANARFFGGNVDLVPKQVQGGFFNPLPLEYDHQALTVGVGTVMDAKEVLVLITGANKAFALYKVLI